MPALTRRHLLAGAAAAAAVAAVAAVAALPAAGIAESAPWPAPPYVDRQQHFDGKIDWTFYARRREWVGVDKVHA